MKASPANEGSISVEILSVYDLPFAEPPQCVTVTVGSVVVKTGPPLSRHKDRNSFRFATPVTGHRINQAICSRNFQSNHASVVQIIAPLRHLYRSSAVIQIVYGGRETLETMYDLNQLRVHECKWLILNLSRTTETRSDGDNRGGSVATVVAAGGTESAFVNNPPTIRIKMNLAGPYRPEVAAVVALTSGWFALVDKVEDFFKEMLIGVPKPSIDFSSVVFIPTISMIIAVVAAFPAIAFITTISLPIILPVAAFFLIFGVSTLAIAGGFYVTSREGRAKFASILSPVFDSFASTSAGQALIYDTGPRPTPVNVLKQILPEKVLGKLLISLLIDFIGMWSYVFPVVGEGLDVAWAPTQTVLIMALYDDIAPSLKFLSFVEEILPFTDVIPSATLGFMLEFAPRLLGYHSLQEGLESVLSLHLTQNDFGHEIPSQASI